MITAKQRAARVKHIGSSDVPAIMGRSPWANAYDVWLEKTGQMEVSEDDSPHLTAGQYRERGLLDWAETKLGKLIRNQYRSAPEFHLGAHIDAIVDAEQNPVEGKSLSLYGGRLEEFGEPGTDAIPEDVILQATTHMVVLEKDGKHPDRAYIPLDHPRLSYQMYEVQYVDELVQAIKNACCTFWDMVVSGTPPDDIPCMKSLKARIREAGKIVEVDPALVAAFQRTKQASSESKKAFDAAEAELITAMKDGDCADGGTSGMVTYYPRKGSSRPDREAMKKDGVWDRYEIKGKPFRVPVWRKPKEDDA